MSVYSTCTLTFAVHPPVPVCCSLQDSDEPNLLPPPLEGREVLPREERQSGCEGQGGGQHLLAAGRGPLEQRW